MSVTILNRGTVAVARGSLILFSAFESDGPMWVGSGTREERRRIAFGGSFVVPPVVHVGLSMWDVSNQSNMRVQVSADEIDAEGFAAVARTWGDTRIARVAVSWIAIGTVIDPDLWDV